MTVLPDVKLIESSTVIDQVGTKRPLFELMVSLGFYSPPEMLSYTWSITQMTKRSLHLRINFENPIYVSTEEEPEQL